MKHLLFIFGVAFFSHSIDGTFNKICVYDYLGEHYTKTIKNYEYCPYTIRVGY